ncbi:hypothetical protein DICPUDRAFT_157112 [Dictyostelium purpureum]|uniref:Uncharacterized protein n=1 Tax=Dictyostelium purpureum TaxID=5786 RepID=F0ZYA4_DICPU|nr:uncharacterized protein DICPUDRAFT_157112 [Dictyostelium purpureum]EGC31071.1 hypothetical protein DICPUDRAFT_157112 [Dictyostelium purpureum]|eukprot:XP_003292397.1 hypothetical protein DICPUDRAFT_157112 [Dictyostelium purpureum]
MEYYEAKAYANLLKNNKNMFEQNNNQANKKTESSKGFFSFLFKSKKNNNNKNNIEQEQNIETTINSQENENTPGSPFFIPAKNIEKSKTTLF